MARDGDENNPESLQNGRPMIRMSAIQRDVKAHIALCGRWKATQRDFDAKYRWCGNAGTQVAIRRIAADDRPQSLRDSSPGPASGDGLRPRASRIALAYKQLPGIVRRFQQQVPCSIGATRRNVDNSRAFDHIGRFGWTSCPCSLTLEAWAFLIQEIKRRLDGCAAWTMAATPGFLPCPT